MAVKNGHLTSYRHSRARGNTLRQHTFSLELTWRSRRGNKARFSFERSEIPAILVWSFLFANSLLLATGKFKRARVKSGKFAQQPELFTGCKSRQGFAVGKAATTRCAGRLELECNVTEASRQ